MSVSRGHDPQPPERPSDPQWRFRWELLLWPLGILFGVWACEQVGVIPHFATIIEGWGIETRRFAQLAALLIVLSGVLLVMKFAGAPPDGGSG